MNVPLSFWCMVLVALGLLTLANFSGAVPEDMQLWSPGLVVAFMSVVGIFWAYLEPEDDQVQAA